MDFFKNNSSEDLSWLANKPWVILVMVFGVVGGLLYLIVTDNKFTRNDRDLRENLLKEYRGIVIEKAKDKANRNVPYIILSDGTRFNYFSSVYPVVEVGDSIITEVNSSEIRIVKKDTIIYRDYVKDEWQYWDDWNRGQKVLNNPFE
ncbi:MAG: hypothetical protein LBI72_00455 [Flavobacteriaceae bacterium]|jgi:hypothetical protein|nr:hypothetical protein [Flavobacteriaceae bacterium]